MVARWPGRRVTGRRAATGPASVPPGPPVLSPIVAEVYGPDEAGRIRTAERVRAAFAATPGIVSIDDTVADPAPRVVLRVDQAKAALLGFTKSWAREYAAHNITVNAVAPGFILTPMTQASNGAPDRLAQRITRIPIGRHGEPVDISYAVAWLASDEAGCVTGQVLSPNGGEYIT